MLTKLLLCCLRLGSCATVSINFCTNTGCKLV